jgi:hypothetical protein
MKLFSPDAAHWYQRNGQPLHTVLSSKGQPRPTTLRDARQLNLLPSVTNILGVIAKHELTAWLQEQAVMAALTLPRLPGEAEDAFARRVVADSQSTRDGAADFGTAFHAGAERLANTPTQEVDAANPAADWLRHYREWYQGNVAQLHWTEKVLVNDALGYAGTADLFIQHAVHGPTLVDLKTMKFPTGRKSSTSRPCPLPDRGGEGAGRPKPYKSWCYQLAAYRKALGQRVTCLNLIVNSNEPSAPMEQVWSEAEMEAGLQAFEAAQKLWAIEKAYNPTEKRKAET